MSEMPAEPSSDITLIIFRALLGSISEVIVQIIYEIVIRVVFGPVLACERCFVRFQIHHLRITYASPVTWSEKDCNY